jgi:hypothetical protein
VVHAKTSHQRGQDASGEVPPMGREQTVGGVAHCVFQVQGSHGPGPRMDSLKFDRLQMGKIYHKCQYLAELIKKNAK